MTHHISDHIILHLSLIDGIGPATIALLIEQINYDDLIKIYDFSISDFQQCGISYQRAEKLVQGLRHKASLEQELALIAKHNINWCALGSLAYPKLLSTIEQPPAILYYQGANLFAYNNSIAFVGARNADGYARKIVNILVPPLIEKDFVIVSGGALGTDSFVHEAVIHGKGKTIAVLGSGLLHWYPASNYTLFSQIIASGGMIVSSFSLQTKPIPAHFPARNRIISGLSQGTVVVQAASKSGALITADFAVEQGREVFAVPGSIEYGLHDGCHALIQQGAKLVSTAQDIISEFGFTIKNHTIDNAIEQIHHNCPYEKIILENSLLAISTEMLLHKVDLSLEALMAKLFDLSLQGKIDQDIMGLWKRI